LNGPLRTCLLNNHDVARLCGAYKKQGVFNKHNRKPHMTHLTFGTDPEFMVWSRNKKKVVSAIPLLLGSNKYSKLDLGDGFSIFPDNVLAEGTFPPSLNTEQTIKNFRDFITKVQKVLEDQSAHLITRAAHNYDKNELNHPDAKLAGCSPEFCAWSMSEVNPPNLSRTNLRTSGGHIHMGVDSYQTKPADHFLLNLKDKVASVRACDKFVGVADIFLNSDETSPIRKKIYGKSGRYRGRDLAYGVEYRTPSNFWCSRPELVSFFDRLTRYTIGFCEEDPDRFLNDDFPEETSLGVARSIIDKNLKKEAGDFLAKVLPAELYKEAASLAKLPFSENLVKNYGL
jgi:hypothetical protein